MTSQPSTRRSLLVRLRNAGDQAAWQEFLAIYEPLVYRLARAKGFQDADARDLCQDVFRAVAGAIERWDPSPERGSFRGWLFRIARNLMINFLARERHGARGSGDSDVAAWLDEQPQAEDDTAEFDFEYRRQVFRWAAAAVEAEFRPSTWQAFWRTAVEGQETKTVAEQLQLTPGAVYIARSRVLARLRAKIEEAAVLGEEPRRRQTEET